MNAEQRADAHRHEGEPMNQPGGQRDEDAEARRILELWDEWSVDPRRLAVAAYARRLEQRVAERDARIAAAREHIEQAAELALGHEAWPAIADAYAALDGEAGA